MSRFSHHAGVVPSFGGDSLFHGRRGSRPAAAFTWIELLVVISIIALLIGLLLPALGAQRRTACGMKNSSQLRGQHQSMVIYASTNNTYLPGFNRLGAKLADGPATGDSGDGGTPAARYWILLNGQFIPGDLIINPQDTKTKWSGGTVSVANFSYGMLQIGDATADRGRQLEWRDLANSQAIMISDRNTGTSTADTQVKSLWTTKPGDWRGNLVWGDNHAEFVQSNRGLMTRYQKSTNSNDNLFLDGPSVPGASATEGPSSLAGSNAMMVWE